MDKKEQLLNTPIDDSTSGSIYKYLLLVASMLIVLGGVALLLRLSSSGFAIVQTTSMLPTLKPGDLVLIEPVEPSEVKPGDIIAYNLVAYDIAPDGTPMDLRPTRLITHRVIKVINIGGRVYFKTKGDNNPMPDPWYVPAEGVRGRVEKLLSLGSFGLVLTSPTGRLLLALLFISSIVLAVSIAFEERDREQVYEQLAVENEL